MDTRIDFVNNELSACVAAAAPYVARVEYVDEETADIVCNNGYRYHVCIAADSKAAIVQDVIAEVLRH